VPGVYPLRNDKRPGLSSPGQFIVNRDKRARLLNVLPQGMKGVAPYPAAVVCTSSVWQPTN